MLKKLDKKILYTTLFIVFSGFFIFFSASLSGLVDKEFYSSIFFTQIIAIFLGLFCMFFVAMAKFFDGKFFRKNCLVIFIIAFIFQILVFVPGLGQKYNGSTRWINLEFITIQPSEFFKYAFILFLSACIAALSKKLKKISFFIIFLSVIFTPLFVIFWLIKDYGTLGTIIFASLSVFFVSKEIKYKFVFIPVFFISFVLIPIVYFFVPYVNERIEVFLNPQNFGAHDSAYQVNQMKIAIGSGQISGRGFGSSLQKFSGKIPEPLGDSIFSVYSEEFGFFGSVFLIFVFLLLLFFILLSAHNLKNSFEKMVVVGFAILLIFPVFYNISSTMGIVPLSGMPITFVSKGGTAILFSLIMIGVILSITRKHR